MKFPFYGHIIRQTYVPNKVASKNRLHFKPGKLRALGCFMQSHVQFPPHVIYYKMLTIFTMVRVLLLVTLKYANVIQKKKINE